MNHQHQILIEEIMPYRMRSVAIMNLALRHVSAWVAPARIEIYFDGRLAIEGLSTAFTNCAIEAGILHCRAILEFLGLQVSRKDHTKLISRQKKRDDTDLWIRDFEGPDGVLQPVAVSEALAHYEGKADEAQTALARVCHIANKGVAHCTTSLLNDADDLRLMEIASRGVPTLVVSHFYTKLGLPAPDYLLTSRLPSS